MPQLHNSSSVLNMHNLFGVLCAGTLLNQQVFNSHHASIYRSIGKRATFKHPSAVCNSVMNNDISYVEWCCFPSILILIANDNAWMHVCMIIVLIVIVHASCLIIIFQLCMLIQNLIIISNIILAWINLQNEPITCVQLN